MMDKQQMIAAIRKQNKSVSDAYLTHFDEKVLQAYLSRLTNVLGQRGRSSIWTRPDDAHAIVARSV